MRERALVERMLRGDRGAAETFVREYSPRVHRLLVYLTGRPHDADDLTQETFLKAWQSLSGFRGEAALATWLRQIAYREYLSWLRARKEHVWIDEVPELPAPADQPVERLLLAGALASLSREHREAILLHHVEGLSIKEVAAILEIPSGTVMSRLFHARQLLRRTMSTEETHHETGSTQPAAGERAHLSKMEPRRWSC